MMNIQKIKKGFTLVETMVAISLLTVSIIAPMALTTQSLQSAYYARDQIIASNLAQEGIELVRNHRDDNILLSAEGTPTDILNGIPINQPFTVDATKTFATEIQSCGGSACPLLQTDGILYGYSIGTTTPFLRTVLATYVNATNQDEIRLQITVTWQTGSYASRSIVLYEDLYRWVNDGSAAH